jgi:hypothetical protein
VYGDDFKKTACHKSVSLTLILCGIGTESATCR